MSIKLLTGVKRWDYTSRNGTRYRGMSIYYHDTLSPRDGVIVKGTCSGYLSIPLDTPLEAKMLAADYSEAFEADVIFDLIPGEREPIVSDIEF
jgi:hypothetical protein